MSKTISRKLKRPIPKNNPPRWLDFNVYPGKGNREAKENKLYFRVMVYSNIRWLREGYRFWMDCEEHNSEVLGAVIPFRKFIVPPKGSLDRSKWSDIIGVTIFAKNLLAHDVIAHEAVHMATTYLRYTRQSIKLLSEIDPVIEERLAYTVDNCVRQLVTEIHQKLSEEKQ